MKILLLGKNGQIGWELERSLMPLGEVIALDSKQCDLSNPETIPDVIRTIKPDVIVNAAAYTAVDKAEQEEILATIINGTSVGVIAEEAKKLNALLVHYSTDYVFDGTKIEPYTEKDIPNPINAYGRSKLVGEKAIEKSGCDYIILRTTWVYASRGNNFLLTMLRLAKEREELKIVSDQYGAPTWARNISDVTAYILHKIQNNRLNDNFSSAIYHFSASGKTSWYGFSVAIIEQAKHLTSTGNIKTKSILPLSTEDYPLPAKRPKNSLMDSSVLVKRFELSIQPWEYSMILCVKETLASL